MKNFFGRSFGFVTAVAAFAAVLGITSVASHDFYPTPAHATTGTSALTGWAWSDNIGWISLSGTNPTYGVTEDGSGNLTGYAWSDGIGWIKFGGLSAFPPNGASNSNATVDSNGTLNGWVRACAGTADGQCINMSSRTDGWDGWISLNGMTTGTPPSSYGVNFASGNGQYSQGAWIWGSDVVGWITFNPLNATSTQCNPAIEVCSGSGSNPLTPSVNLSISTTTVATGTPATLSWGTSNITTCTESSSGIGTGSGGADTNWNSALTTGTSSGSQLTSSFSRTGTEYYQLTCTATAAAGGGSLASNQLTLTVSANPSGPGNMCTRVPTNATLCPGSTQGSAQSTLLSSPSSCPTGSGTYLCEYICDPNYVDINGRCVASTTIQEQ